MSDASRAVSARRREADAQAERLLQAADAEARAILSAANAHAGAALLAPELRVIDLRESADPAPDPTPEPSTSPPTPDSSDEYFAFPRRAHRRGSLGTLT